MRWLPVLGYEDCYEVSDEGQVRSIARPPLNGRRGKSQRILKQVGSGKGYLTVVLSDGKRGVKRFYVHRLMMAAFIRPSDLQVRHFDDNILNNQLSNLKYGTQKDNEQDKLRNGNNANLNKTHCKWGHEYTKENIYIQKDRLGRTGRRCRECGRRYKREYLARKRVG